MVGFASSALMSWNALSWDGPHNHVDFLLSNCRRGCVRSARLCENFPS